MNYEYLSIGAGVLSIILLVVVGWLFMRVQKLNKIRQEFLLDDTTKKVDDVLVEHNQRIKHLGEHLDETRRLLTELTAENKHNYQKIGFVRFNPFGDAGGSISFVIALLDADSNGFVLSSLHGREGNRVYAKEVKQGTSKSQLTEEEQEAIKNAA